MKSVGIREAKARLSALARAAAKGEVTVLTDYGKPIAVIGPIEPAAEEMHPSNGLKFRQVLLAIPYGLDVDF